MISLANHFINVARSVVLVERGWEIESAPGRRNLYYSCKTSTLGLKLIQALSDAEWKQAILNFSKTSNHNLTEAFKDNVVLDYAGVRYPNCRTGIGSR